MVLGCSQHLLWCWKSISWVAEATQLSLLCEIWRSHCRSAEDSGFATWHCQNYLPSDKASHLRRLESSNVTTIFFFLSVFYKNIPSQCEGYLTPPSTVTIFSISYTLLHSYYCIPFQCVSKVNMFLFYFKNSVLKIFIYICASCTAYKNNVCPRFMVPPEQVIALCSHPPPPPPRLITLKNRVCAWKLQIWRDMG